MGKAHGQVGPADLLRPDKRRALHCFGKAVALLCIGCGTYVLRAGFAKVFAADGLIAPLPVFAAGPAALIAEKFHLILLGLRQSFELVKRFVQTEIRHHKAELLPFQLPAQLGKLRQDLGGGGHKVKARVPRFQVLQQQLRVDDDPILHAAARFKQRTQGIAFRVAQVLLLQQ